MPVIAQLPKGPTIVDRHRLAFQLELDLAAVMVGFNIPRMEARRLAKEVVTQAAQSTVLRRNGWNWNSGREPGQ